MFLSFSRPWSRGFARRDIPRHHGAAGARDAAVTPIPRRHDIRATFPLGP
jgi:hypothetical protein